MPAGDPPRPGPPAHPPRHPQLVQLRHRLGADDELPIDPDLEPEDARGPSRTHHPHTAPPPSAKRPAVLVAVFVGGALGALARDAVALGWSQRPGHFPTAIFVVNTAGAFLLGLLLTVLLERLPSRTRLLRPFLATGVLGGWTTYSTFVVTADALVQHGHPVVAAGYVTTTLVCGVVAAAIGIGLGRLEVKSGSGGKGGSDGGAGAAPAVAAPADRTPGVLGQHRAR